MKDSLENFLDLPLVTLLVAIASTTVTLALCTTGEVFSKFNSGTEGISKGILNRINTKFEFHKNH